ncbi:hypothetical protein ZWY2020_008457 [Hordeum vulgare]|nr:hypothetical protein ZWY2020_008457 [Hordeum vulgare]
MSFYSGSCKLNKLAATYSADGLSRVLNEKRYWKDWVSVDSPTICNERSGAAGTLLLPSCSYEDSKLKMYEGKSFPLYEALGVLYEGHIAQGRHSLTSRKPPTITKSGSNFGPKEKMVASSIKRNTRDRSDDSMRTPSIIDINDIPAWDDVDGDAERENTVRDEEEFGSDADGDHPQISESSAKGRRPKKQKSATSVQRLEDSMMAVEIVMAFEEEFSFEIPDNEAEKIDSIKSAVDFIASHPQANMGGRGGRGGGRGRTGGSLGAAAAAEGQGGPVAPPVIKWYCEHCKDTRHDNQTRHMAMHAYLDRQETQQLLRHAQAREAYLRAHGGPKKKGNRNRH